MLNLIDRASNRLVLNPQSIGKINKQFTQPKSNIKTQYVPAFSQGKALEHSSESIEERYSPGVTL